MSVRAVRIALGAALAVTLVAGTSLPVSAAPISFDVFPELNGGNTNAGGSTLQITGAGLDDISMFCKVDAFDDAMLLYFDQGGGPDDLDLYEAPGDQGDQTETPAGTRITADAVTGVSGIEVSIDLLVFGDLSVPGTALVRQVFELANPGATEITDTFRVETDYGSDSYTTVEASSSGGSSVVDDTGWVVTSDTGVLPGGNDPVNLTAHQGPQPTDAAPTLVKAPGGDPGSASDDWRISFEVTVPAGETRYLAFFTVSYDWCDTEEFTEAVSAATAYAANFASGDAVLSAGLFAGIPEADLPLIANWAVSPGPAPTTTSTTIAPTPTTTPAPTNVDLNLQLGFGVGDTVRDNNATATTTGRGLAPLADLLLVLRSSPQVIGSAVTSATGNATVVGTIPPDTPAGVHSLTGESVDPDGNVVAARAWFTLDANGIVTAISYTGPTPPSGAVVPVSPRFTG